MKKMLLAAAVGALALTSASAAFAQSPVGGPYHFQGTVNVSYSISLVCTLDADVVVPTVGDADVTTMSLTGGLCGAVQFISLPWDVDPGPGAGQVTINGVTARTVFGTVCGPENIVATWNNGPPPSITFPVGTEINPPTPGCKIDGTITQTNGPPYLSIP